MGNKEPRYDIYIMSQAYRHWDFLLFCCPVSYCILKSGCFQQIGVSLQDSNNIAKPNSSHEIHNPGNTTHNTELVRSSKKYSRNSQILLKYFQISEQISALKC